MILVAHIIYLFNKHLSQNVNLLLLKLAYFSLIQRIWPQRNMKGIGNFCPMKKRYPEMKMQQISDPYGNNYYQDCSDDYMLDFSEHYSFAKIITFLRICYLFDI